MASGAAPGYAKKGKVAFLTLPPTGTKNVINLPAAQKIAYACARINHDDEVAAVVIIGAGKFFYTGEDETGVNLAAAIAGIECPVIAAINGDAIGYGLELALACDIRLAAESARFGMPQIARGRLPVNGGTQRLARLAGKSAALDLLLTARTITAEEALGIGLVNRVLPAAKLVAEAEAMASAIADKAPLALRYIKEAVQSGLEMPLAQGLRLEADLYFFLHTTADRTEGIRAFLEKRPPQFKGE